MLTAMRAHRGVDGIAVEAASVRRTSVHRHPEIIEFVYALRGELDVQVSSEQYLLEEGDFALLNAGDTHSFEGRRECTVVTLQIDVAAFADEFPELPSKIFACESFDLARYLGTEAYLRDVLLAIFAAPPADRRPLVSALLHDLIEFYGVEQYYDRRRVINHTRRALLRTMLTLLRTHASERNVLERISDEMNYSKGALSRLTRDAMGMSFSDILTNLRLTRAEVLLLESDDTMVSIAHACGFSDVKYFTRAFRAWFGCTPAAYRTAHRGRVHAGDDLDPLGEPLPQLVEQHRAVALPSGRPTRRSATPIAVVTSAAAPDTFDSGSALPQIAGPSGVRDRPSFSNGPTPAEAPHLLPIRVLDDAAESAAEAAGANDREAGDPDAADRWRDIWSGVDRELYRPVLIVPADRGADAARIVAELRAHGDDLIELWVTYRFGDAGLAESVAADLRALPGVTATPMLAA